MRWSSPVWASPSARPSSRTVRFDLRKPFDVLAKIRESNDWRPQWESKGAFARHDASQSQVPIQQESAAASSAVATDDHGASTPLHDRNTGRALVEDLERRRDEATATARAALHRATPDALSVARAALDLAHALSREIDALRAPEQARVVEALRAELARLEHDERTTKTTGAA